MSTKQIIKKLEEKVESAVDLIRGLKQANRKLYLEREAVQKKLKNYEMRIKDLEKVVDSAQKEQYVLEKSVLAALSNLDEIEELQHHAAENAPEHKNSSVKVDDDTQIVLERESQGDNVPAGIDEIIFDNEENSYPSETDVNKTEEAEIF